MKYGISALILLSTFVFSCAEDQSGYNSVYLQMFEKEYLYVFNQSERHLCVDDEIQFCQNNYKLTSMSYKMTSHRNYTSGDNILIKTYDYSTSIVFYLNKNNVITYTSSYPIGTQFAPSNSNVSSIQSPGYCDLSFLIHLLDEAFAQFYLEIQYDLYSLSTDPEMCRFSQVVSCLMGVGLGYSAGSEISEDKMKTVLSCFNMVYSLDAVLEESETSEIR